MARENIPLVICGLRHLVGKGLLALDETLPARSLDARLTAWCDLDLPREAVAATLAAACLESGRRGYLGSEIIGALGDGGMLDRLDKHLRAQRVRCPVRVSVVDVDLDDFRTFNALAVESPGVGGDKVLVAFEDDAALVRAIRDGLRNGNPVED
jgi:hypothetical protein